MDLILALTVAGNVIKFLMPHITKGFGEEAGKTAVKDLYETIKNRLSSRPEASEAIQKLEAAPQGASETEEAQKRAAKKLAIAMNENPDFGKQIKDLFKRAQAESRAGGARPGITTNINGNVGNVNNIAEMHSGRVDSHVTMGNSTPASLSSATPKTDAAGLVFERYL